MTVYSNSVRKVKFCATDANGAAGPKKGRKSRRRGSTVGAADSSGNNVQPVAEPEVASAAPAAVVGKVLMVEVDNVVHEPYKTTEEIKVGQARLKFFNDLISSICIQHARSSLLICCFRSALFLCF